VTAVSEKPEKRSIVCVCFEFCRRGVRRGGISSRKIGEKSAKNKTFYVTVVSEKPEKRS
jgi:hypothetical protein